MASIIGNSSKRLREPITVQNEPEKKKTKNEEADTTSNTSWQSLPIEVKQLIFNAYLNMSTNGFKRLLPLRKVDHESKDVVEDLFNRKVKFPVQQDLLSSQPTSIWEKSSDSSRVFLNAMLHTMVKRNDTYELLRESQLETLKFLFTIQGPILRFSSNGLSLIDQYRTFLLEKGVKFLPTTLKINFEEGDELEECEELEEEEEESPAQIAMCTKFQEQMWPLLSSQLESLSLQIGFPAFEVLSNNTKDLPKISNLLGNNSLPQLQCLELSINDGAMLSWDVEAGTLSAEETKAITNLAPNLQSLTLVDFNLKDDFLTTLGNSDLLMKVHKLAFYCLLESESGLSNLLNSNKIGTLRHLTIVFDVHSVNPFAYTNLLRALGTNTQLAGIEILDIESLDRETALHIIDSITCNTSMTRLKKLRLEFDGEPLPREYHTKLKNCAHFKNLRKITVNFEGDNLLPLEKLPMELD